MGFGSALGGNTLASALISNWFVKHRGAVLGVVLCASGVGGAVFSQMVNYWITEFGWRHSYRTSFVIALVCALVVVALVRTKPEEMGLRPLQSDTGGDFVSKKTGGKEGVTLREAMRTPLFYIIMPCAFFIGFLNNPIYVSVPAQMADAGFSPAASATVSSILFLSIAVSKILLGIIHDRFGLTPTLCICFLSNIVGLALLVLAATTWQYYLFAVVFGLSIPQESLMLSLIVSKVFGQKEHAAFIGISLAMNSAGIAVGNPVLGWCCDTFGGYTYALLACLVISAIVFAVILAATNRKTCE